MFPYLNNVNNVFCFRWKIISKTKSVLLMISQAPIFLLLLTKNSDIIQKNFRINWFYHPEEQVNAEKCQISCFLC